MKKIYASLMTCLLMLIIASASCSKDDEPQDYAPTYDGVSIYLNVLDKLYTDEGDPAFTPTSTEGVYAAMASSAEASANFIKELVEDPSWNGADLNVALGENGENGSLKIVGQTEEMKAEGIFNQLIVDVKDYTPFTLEIIDETAAAGVNGGDVVKIDE